MLSEAQHAKIAQPVASWLTNDEAFAAKAIDAVDLPRRDDKAWLIGRDSLRLRIFDHLVQHVTNEPAPSLSMVTFFTAAQQSDWKVESIAERMLTIKIRRFAQQNEDSAQSLEAWRAALIPLCAKELHDVRKALIESLATTNRPSVFIAFARKAVWTDIPPEAASPLAEAILRDPKAVLNQDGTATDLFALPGFVEVARVIYKQLPSKGPAWIQREANLMKALSARSLEDENSTRRFQSAVIDTLVATTNNDYAALGLVLLKDHARITADLQRSLGGWVERLDKNDPLRTKVEGASQLPVFQGN